MEPDGPVARGGNLVVLEVHEFVGGDVVGQVVGTLGHQHGGEYYAVEDDVVLADEVYHACFRVFPPGFPVVGAQVLGVRNVADGGVEPHV